MPVWRMPGGGGGCMCVCVGRGGCMCVGSVDVAGGMIHVWGKVLYGKFMCVCGGGGEGGDYACVEWRGGGGGVACAGR